MLRTLLLLFWLLSFILFPEVVLAATPKQLLEKGWQALVKDHDSEALTYFNQAYNLADKQNNTAYKATSLLHLGIAVHGASYTEGMEYAIKALAEYKKLESTSPEKARTGRSQCLQLISTIKSRQGNFKEAVSLSKEALEGFGASRDTTGTRGLIYTSLGTYYSRLNLPKEAEKFYNLALQEHLKAGNPAYLPGAYIKVGEVFLNKGNRAKSSFYLNRAKSFSDSTGNKQAQVSSLLSLAKWSLTFENNLANADSLGQKALRIATGLSDKAYRLKALKQLLLIKKQKGEYKVALAYTDEITALHDSLTARDKQNTLKLLETKFKVSEKDRQLQLIQKEKEVALLTNYLLWGFVVFTLVAGTGLVIFLRRINKRDRELLLAKEALVQAEREQQQLKELQMHNELEFKESQLSALALQMLQKNELLQELKQKLDQEKNSESDISLQKIISKGLNHDKEWTDFNTTFESLNKNFYARLKQSYPGISPYDMKICALIKLNLSSKEMAGILNISPDSVKTARYRLRKKLQLKPEDNLTDYIMSL